MFVALWRWRKLLQHLNTEDNKIHLFQDLLKIESSDSDLEVHTLPNELLVRVRFSFNFRQRSRKNKKLSKTDFG